jgi:hypothetical protein
LLPGTYILRDEKLRAGHARIAGGATSALAAI